MVRAAAGTASHSQVEPDDARWTSKPRLLQLAAEGVVPTCEGVLDHATIFDCTETAGPLGGGNGYK
jgi:hypothetical protein